VRRAGVAAALLVTLAACGGGGRQDRVTVFAASSLTEVLQKIEPDARYNFAGSDDLATQIREGGKADVYASADVKHALDLYRDGLVERPHLLASNHVVVIVPRSNPRHIGSLADLSAAGVKIVITAPGIPAGDYARAALADDPHREAILANVVSEEEDVKGVVGKVVLGEADAGFAYRTDIGPTNGKVVELGGIGALGGAEYAVAVVRDGNRDKGEAYIHRLLAPLGRRAFLRAGFVTSSRDGDALPLA
jgi:molybdate transport system substrate-binding protein